MSNVVPTNVRQFPRAPGAVPGQGGLRRQPGPGTLYALATLAPLKPSFVSLASSAFAFVSLVKARSTSYLVPDFTALKPVSFLAFSLVTSAFAAVFVLNVPATTSHFVVAANAPVAARLLPIAAMVRTVAVRLMNHSFRLALPGPGSQARRVRGLVSAKLRWRYGSLCGVTAPIASTSA